MSLGSAGWASCHELTFKTAIDCEVGKVFDGLLGGVSLQSLTVAACLQAQLLKSLRLSKRSVSILSSKGVGTY